VRFAIRRDRRFPAGLLLLALVWMGAGPVSHTARVEIAPGMVASLTDEHQIFLEALPEKGEGLLAFCRRLTGGEEAAPAVAAANGGLKALKVGLRYRVPYGELRPELRLAVIRALFRNDEPRPGAWHHPMEPRGAIPQESLWRVAEWFTGDGQNYRALQQANGLGEDLPPGQVLRIPAHLLLPPFREALPPGPAPEPARPPETRVALRPLPAEVAPAEVAPAEIAAAGEPAPGPPHQLTYGKDPQGDYAAYRLKAGEALYSSVVVRFTGLLLAADVNALAGEIARRSGIADVTDIPVGYEVKIPQDLLLPEYLPPNHPRRQEYEAALAASARFGNRVRAMDLSGITIILDAGHGGKDPGARFSQVWESLHVYDIMLRVRHLLGAYTSAHVVVTTQDGERLVPEDRDVLSFSQGHRVLTTPPYPIEEAVVGTNLRWYLANSIFRRETRRGVEPEKVVFVSIHADSLHPSLRGSMVYIPDAQLRRGSFAKSGAIYQARSEVRERPEVSFSWTSRVESEGLSRDLANRIIAAFQRRGLPVHPFKPVREKIIRRRSQYVPAVLRYNEVPAKVLVEVCNLANPEDQRLIQTRKHRQQIAEAIVAGLLAYYGYEDELPTARVAAAGR